MNGKIKKWISFLTAASMSITIISAASVNAEQNNEIENLQTYNVDETEADIKYTKNELPETSLMDDGSNEQIPEGYAAHYSFDGNIENEVVNDEHIKNDKVGALNSNDIIPTTYYGGDPKEAISGDNFLDYSDETYKMGNSLKLNGNKGAVLDYMLPADTSFTISYWARTPFSTEKVTKPAVFLDSSDYSIVTNKDSSAYNFMASAPMGWYDEFVVKSADGSIGEDKYVYGKEKNMGSQWTMYTYTYDKDTNVVTTYTNGVNAASSDSSAEVYHLKRDSYLYIGVSPWAKGDGAFNGYIDELYVYENVLNQEQITDMYNALKDSGSIGEDENIRTVVYTGNKETDYRCGVVYGRGIEIQHDSTGENNNTMYVTSEYYLKDRWDANEYFPIRESKDGGKTWEQVGSVKDTENNRKKFKEQEDGTYIEVAEDSDGATTYYNTKWSLRHQPTLYELPEDLGDLKAGTVLCVGLAASLSTTSTEYNDFDGNLHTRIDIYYSTDNCRTWNFLSHVTDGFESRCNAGTAIWEPYLIMANGKLYCFYSDERGMSDGGGQKLVATGSQDGLEWGNTFDVANFEEENKTYRPGMPVVTQMSNGKFLMVYEGYAMEGGIPTYVKITDDIEKWNPKEKGIRFTQIRGGSPYCCTMPNGEIVINSAASGDVFVNRDNMTTNTMEQYSTGIERAYSRSLFPLHDGRLFITGAGPSYPTTMSSMVVGVVDLGFEVPEPIITPEPINSKYQAMSYTTGTDCKDSSLHIALSENNGRTFKALNYGQGILYAEADYSKDNVAGVTKKLSSPYLFNTIDGKYGVAALEKTEGSDTDDTDGSVVIYISDDLMNYNKIGYLKVSDTIITAPKIEKNGDTYLIYWTENGKRYEGETDLKTINNIKESQDEYITANVGIDNASAVNAIAIDEKTAQGIKNKLLKLENTEIDVPQETFVIDDKFEINKLPRVKAKYSDGSEEMLEVDWDMSSINRFKKGNYTMKGKISPKEYPEQMFVNRADPNVLNYNGKYYFIATMDGDGQKNLVIRSAETLDGLQNAEDHIIYNSGNNLVWAPELHVINGKLSVMFALGSAWNKMQASIISMSGENPLDASNWGEPIRITDKDGNYLANEGKDISIDMTYFELNGKSYVAWQQGRIDVKSASRIMMAEYNTSENKLESEAVVITMPLYGWERSDTLVDEGPYIIMHDNKVFMTISTNATNSTYSVALLELTNKDNPLSSDSWHKQGYPLLSAANKDSQPGPGHNCFTENEYGESVVVYHYGNGGSGRTTTMRKVHWAADGTPIISMDGSDKINYELANIEIPVEVVSDSDVKKIQPVEIFGSENGQYEIANPFKNVFDEDTKTFFDGVENSYVGIDAGNKYKLREVRVTGRSGYENRMIGLVIQGSDDKENWKDLNVINVLKKNPTALYIDDIDDNTGYRYFRISAGNSMCNIAELEFYGEKIEEEQDHANVFIENGEGVVKASFDVRNTTGEKYDAYMVVYDEDGRMIDIHKEEITNGNKEININVPSDKKYKCSAFVWSGINAVSDKAEVYTK